MTDLVERLAVAQFAAVDDWPIEAGARAFLAGRDAEHSGDCTKQPWTCLRCVYDDGMAEAGKLVATFVEPLLRETRERAAEDERDRLLSTAPPEARGWLAGEGALPPGERAGRRAAGQVAERGPDRLWGGRVTVSLDVGATSGHVWSVVDAYGLTALPTPSPVEGDEVRDGAEAAIGGGFAQAFSFEGSGTAILDLRRPWETTPIRRAVLSVG